VSEKIEEQKGARVEQEKGLSWNVQVATTRIGSAGSIVPSLQYVDVSCRHEDKNVEHKPLIPEILKGIPKSIYDTFC
jgi:hypothetical protein